jgi:beta-glucosidase
MAAFRADQDTGNFDHVRRLVRDHGVGGVVVFGGTVDSLPEELATLQRESKNGLLIASDLEWGLSQQVGGGTEFPSTMAMGATQSPALVREAAEAVASEAIAVGINTIFCPCADVNTTHGNPIIDVRSFGEDPVYVGEMVKAYIEGTLQAGAIPVAKHFPGHGATIQDSHLELPAWSATAEEFAHHLRPFETAIDAGIPAIMVGHILIPRLDSVPTSLSAVAVQRELKDRLGFNGLIFTDALVMEAVSARNGDAGVSALNAGAHVLLYPKDPEDQIAAIVSAFESGRIMPERIEECLNRLAVTRSKVKKEPAQSMENVGSDEHRKLAYRIAEESLTAIGIEAIPRIRSGELVVCLDFTDELRSKEFVSVLESSGESIEVRVLNENDLSQGALNDVRPGSINVLAVFDRVKAYKGRALLPEPAAEQISSRLKSATGTTLILLSSPYVIEQLEFTGPTLLGYGPSLPSARAAANIILSGGTPGGKAPVTLTRPVGE